MTKLVWGQVDQKHYELGVDHGVFYPLEGPGVVWNGLISVNESSEDSTINSYYLDGVKYLDVASSKRFQATIKAFSAPPEFATCIGNRSPRPGLILTRQPRVPFNFSYRTLIDGDEGYKIHLVYNATVSPTKRSYVSVTDRPELTTFEWQIDAVPPPSTTHRPSAHYILNSMEINPYVLTDFESFLYGTDTKLPAIPPQAEVVAIVNNLITEPLTEPI